MTEGYAVHKGIVKEVYSLPHGARRIEVKPEDPLPFDPGQFFIFAVPGSPEFHLPPSGSGTGLIDFPAVPQTGSSSALKLHRNSVIWIRGPYGRGFDFGQFRGRAALIISSSFSLPSLRLLVSTVAADKKKYPSVGLLYEKGLMAEIMEDDLNRWKEQVEVYKLEGGSIPEGIPDRSIASDRISAAAAGSKGQLRRWADQLSARGVGEDFIQIRLQARFSCGCGKCGRCFDRGHYICREGPVFIYGKKGRKML